jgi:hypothetical protein
MVRHIRSFGIERNVEGPDDLGELAVADAVRPLVLPERPRHGGIAQAGTVSLQSSRVTLWGGASLAAAIWLPRRRQA